MLRNGGFESWSQGQSARPDAWQVTSNGMTYIRSLSEYHGGYCIKITKHEDDGDLNVTRRIYMQPGVIQPGILNASIYHAPCYDQVYQTMTGLLGDMVDEEPFTLSGMVKTDTAGHARLFMYDGFMTKYSAWHSGSDEWEPLWVSHQLGGDASRLVVGLQVDPITGSDVDSYFDCIQLVTGYVPHRYQENPDERGVICQSWHNNGINVPVRGAMRAIPFKVTGTTAANPTVHNYTLQYGCRAVCDVTTNLYTFAGDYRLVNVRAANFSATGFSIYIHYYGSMGSWAYTVTGTAHLVGWDDPSEQFT